MSTSEGVKSEGAVGGAGDKGSTAGPTMTQGAGDEGSSSGTRVADMSRCAVGPPMSSPKFGGESGGYSLDSLPTSIHLLPCMPGLMSSNCASCHSV